MDAKKRPIFSNKIFCYNSVASDATGELLIEAD